MLKRYSMLFAFLGVLEAQQVAAPTTESVGSPRGDSVGQYNVTQSFETGYRWSLVGGDQGMYRQVVNFGNGIRLLGSNLTVNSKEGHGHYFDEILLNTLGLGNDPYQAAVLRIQKNGLYRYDLSWRSNAYYSPGLTVAAGTHLRDTNRRLQDHDLTLLPQSRIRFRVGYSRNKEGGPALSTSQEFDANGTGLPVFTDVRRDWNEYRLGLDVNLHGFQFTVTRRWSFFKDDSPYGLNGSVAAGDQTVVNQFVRAEPVHGENHGWLGNLFARKKLWGVNGRITYVSGRRDFVTNEVASGTGQFGGAASRVIMVSGDASRPVTAGDFAISLFPSERLTVINNTSVTSNRIDGASTYTEFNGGFDLGTTLNFRYLGILLVTNATDINFRMRPWIGFYAGYRFSDRRVRTVESFGFAAETPDTQRYEVSNTLHSGVLGVRLKPWKPVTLNVEGEVGRADSPLTPVSEQNYHLINGRAEYRVRKLQLSTSYRQNYNLNSSSALQAFSAHSRNYTANASWSPKDGFSIDANYMKLHLDTRTGLAFFAAVGPRPQLQTDYPSLYESNVHAGYLAAHFNLAKRANVLVGYSITKDTGGSVDTQVNPANVLESLLRGVRTFPMTYQSPMARLSIRITPKLRWNAAWQYYGYDDNVVLGFVQNFRAHTGYTSLLWAF